MKQSGNVTNAAEQAANVMAIQVLAMSLVPRVVATRP